ncbi:hypothetical protein QNH36_02370 [Mesobacillus sp. AQ2]|uniref:SF0329 family protein n=1 Tax=Bacillaceae TaxID=186817 RepID=UPI0011AA7E0F|nr:MULTISPECIES: hypothetical protein [Bacillaceae]MCM3125277.1 hypothetical protein [Mesobacillus sp. MER 33]MCM3235292.1 hypothetical protein [Mesobacillus sp. MER 48]WHX41029.1 hypothetical protein QNH36_02370 [Mesobacillus sp. AQ2]
MRSQLWSKLKKRLDSLICDSLKGRVNFTVTNYRRAHDQMGRAFVTVDKKEVLNMCTITSDIRLHRKDRELHRLNEMGYDDPGINREIGVTAHELVKKEGIYAQYDFYDSVEEFLNLPIDQALKSEDMVVKILALIDRRAGKRTLIKLRESIKNELEIIQYFYSLRCEAEQIND